MSIEVRNVSKQFQRFAALRDVSFDVEKGELVALLGPSGSGKTTLLRIIAGLEAADTGQVLLDGTDSSTRRPRERQVGFVFQHYALFRHMRVFDNVAFGLRVRPRSTRPDEEEIHRRVMELLSLVHLERFHNRFPHELSGGQRQRVALARALAVEPKVLLLDEPFGALDAKVRKELRRWMRRLHDELHVTSLFVTHDQEEAMEVADRVIVMNQGRIEQMGGPGEVYYNPANAFVYDFLGNYNEFEGWKDENGDVHLNEYTSAETAEPPPLTAAPQGMLRRYPEIGRLLKRLMPRVTGQSTPTPGAPLTKPAEQDKGKPVRLFARPHEMYVAKTIDAHEYIAARVIHLNPAGPLVKLELERLNGALLQAEVPKEIVDQLSIARGDSLFVRPKRTKVFE